MSATTASLGLQNAPPSAGSAPVPRLTPGWLRGVLCVLAAAPVAAAIGASKLSTQTAPFHETRDRVPLAFEQYQVNLGYVPAVREVAGRFTFRNTGEKTIHITQLEPSCGCLNPRLERRIYAPGESGTFHVRVQTASESAGPHEFTVKVHYDEQTDTKTAEAREPVTLAFKLIVPEKQISLRPRALVFYQLGNEATTQDVLVIDERGTDLELTSITSSSPLVKVAVAGKEIKDGLVQHTLKVTAAANAPRGRTRALVTVRTSDPAYRMLQIPLIIQGPESGSQPVAQVDVEPPQVVFPSSAGLLTQPRDIVVTGPAGKPFEVKSIESLTPAITARVIETKTDAAGRPQVRLRVFIAGPPSDRGVRDVLTLKTSDAAQPQVQVPVSIEGSIRQASEERPANESPLR